MNRGDGPATQLLNLFLNLFGAGVFISLNHFQFYIFILKQRTNLLLLLIRQLQPFCQALQLHLGSRHHRCFTRLDLYCLFYILRLLKLFVTLRRGYRNHPQVHRRYQ